MPPSRPSRPGPPRRLAPGRRGRQRRSARPSRWRSRVRLRRSRTRPRPRRRARTRTPAVRATRRPNPRRRAARAIGSRSGSRHRRGRSGTAPGRSRRSGSTRSPRDERATISASSASRQAGRSDAGSAWAIEPPTVPRLRTCRSPMIGSTSRSRPYASAGEPISSAYVVSAPMASRPSSSCRTPLSSAMPTDVHELVGEGEPHLEERQQALSACEELDRTVTARQSAQRLIDRRRALVIERCRDHAWPPFAVCIARQTVCGVYGISRCRMPSGLSRIDDGVGHRGRARDRARLADALDADGVDRRRRDRLVELEVREIRRPRQRVVEHRAREELPLVAVDRALPERLSDALGDAAVQLAVHDHRVDLLADVVDRDVAHELDAAGLLVDLDDRDVRPERPRAVRRVVVGRLVEVRLHPLGRVEREVERERDLLDRLDPVRAALARSSSRRRSRCRRPTPRACARRTCAPSRGSCPRP